MEYESIRNAPDRYIRQLRSLNSHTVLVVLCHKMEDIAIVFLKSGADDVLEVPCSDGYLMAKTMALIRRQKEEIKAVPLQTIKEKELEISYISREVKERGKYTHFTKNEFEILWNLVTNKGKVLSKKEIYEMVWRQKYICNDTIIASYIRKLRGKIEADPTRPKYIETVWGIGYCFVDDNKNE